MFSSGLALSRDDHESLSEIMTLEFFSAPLGLRLQILLGLSNWNRYIPTPYSNLKQVDAMAGSVNKVILVGNLGKDPEVRSMQTGSKVCNLSLATSERWRDRTSGEMREKTEWHRVVIFNERLIDVAEKYLRKGSTIYIEGALQTRKWTDQQGVEKYSTEIVIQNFNGQLTMLGGRSDNAGAGGGGGYGGGYSDSSSSFGGNQSSGNQSGGSDPFGSSSSSGSSFGGGSTPPDLDDDIPF